VNFNALPQDNNCAGGLTTAAEGANSFYAASKDVDANQETTQQATVNIDTTPPTIAGNPSPAANDNGWNKSDVVVDFTCNDSLSGIASCPSSQAFSAEGADQASGTAMDNAGNSAKTTVGINIDKTAPTTACSVASPGPIFTLGGAGVVDATVADALSGHAVSPVWASANAASVGNKTVSLIGADRAGNTQAATCPYRVKYGFSGFQGIKSTYRIGSTIPVVFKLTYADGSPLPSTEVASLVAGCLVKVGLDAASDCATYKKGGGLFTASIKVGPYLGAHSIVADVFAPNGSGLVNHETSPVSIRK
jgi:hypothetical protein